MANDYAFCKWCGTEWCFETSGNRLTGGWSGFFWATWYAHIRWCEHASPKERLEYIDRNEKRLARKPNLHTRVDFDRSHPGVFRAVELPDAPASGDGAGVTVNTQPTTPTNKA